MASWHHSRMSAIADAQKLKCPVWVTKQRLGVDQPQQKVSCQGRPLGLQGIVQVQIRSWTSICSQAAKLFMYKRLL